MPPCSRCTRRNTKCVVSDESKRCAECVKSSVKCDATSPSLGDWERLQREEERLAREMDAAMNQAQEAMARQLRLARQQKLLKARGGEMLRRGLATLDELNEAEEAERKKAEAEASVPTTTDPSAHGVDSPNLFSSLSPSF